jgi:hypothetical protein
MRKLIQCLPPVQCHTTHGDAEQARLFTVTQRSPFTVLGLLHKGWQIGKSIELFPVVKPQKGTVQPTEHWGQQLVTEPGQQSQGFLISWRIAKGQVDQEQLGFFFKKKVVYGQQFFWTGGWIQVDQQPLDSFGQGVNPAQSLPCRAAASVMRVLEDMIKQCAFRAQFRPLLYVPRQRGVRRQVHQIQESLERAGWRRRLVRSSGGCLNIFGVFLAVMTAAELGKPGLGIEPIRCNKGNGHSAISHQGSWHLEDAVLTENLEGWGQVLGYLGKTARFAANTGGKGGQYCNFGDFSSHGAPQR